MLFILKNVVLVMLFWFALTLPGSAESAEMTYRIVKLNIDVKKEVRNRTGLILCGDYFIAGESTEGKIIHFSFEEKSTGKRSRMLVFSTIDRVTVSTDEKMKHPSVTIIKSRLGTKLVLKMNDKNYMSGLPCLPHKRSENLNGNDA